MHIETITTINPYKQIVYNYWIKADYDTLDIILNEYMEQSRQSLRHKWVSEKKYHKLFKRDSNLVFSEITVPNEVKEAIKNQLIAKINFV